MIFKRIILTKVLSNGLRAEFSLVRTDDGYQAALYINGRPIPGPELPMPLTAPKDDITHWMGNRPSVGLTTEEAEKIIREVSTENSVLEHQRKLY